MPRTEAPASSSSSNPLTLAAVTALWIAAFANWPLWRALAGLPEMASWRGALFIVAFALAVAALTLAVLGLFAWRWTVKPVAALFLLAAAIGAHFMGTYGVVLDPTMMVNMLQTDPHEVRDLLSVRLAIGVLLLAVPPLAWLWRARLAPAPLLRQALRNGVAIVVAIALVVAIVV